MIILEGPDNSGKSTLAKKLHYLFSWPVEHSVKPELNGYEGHDREFMAFMHSVQHLSPTALIRDRTYAVSENVYGPIIRHRSMLGVFAEQSIHYLAQSQIPIIYCRPRNELILETGKEEMPGVVENHLLIIERYDSMMALLEHAGAFVCRYNYEEPDAWNKLTRYLMTHVTNFHHTKESIHDFIRRS